MALPPTILRPNPPPPLIPDYTLVRCIGRGSYGEVWLGRDPMGICRAVKIVNRQTFEHDRPYEREFSGIRKFEPVSRLHASQVSILQVGRNDSEGFFYYIMELADPTELPSETPVAMRLGRATEGATAEYSPKTIKSEIRRLGRIPFDECLRTGIALATALDHLHQHGLVHRDIKPSNVIYVGGIPKLADIGLVTDVDVTMSCVGTEGFLPPEGPGTRLADIYSLGKVLYEMATGRDRLEFPELPTLSEVPEMRGRLLELNLVFLRACQTNPQLRYQSARELLADLALLHGGGSLRRARTLEERARRVKRVLLGFGVIVAVGAALWGYWDTQRTHKFRQDVAQAQREMEIRRQTEQEKTLRLIRAYEQNAERLVARQDFAGAAVWLAHANTLRIDSPEPTNLVRTVHSLLVKSFAPREALQVGGPVTLVEGGLHTSAWLVLDSQTNASIWDPTQGSKPLAALSLEPGIVQAVGDADGRNFLILSADGTVIRWDRLTQSRQKLEGLLGVRQLAHDTMGRVGITVTAGGKVTVWDLLHGDRRLEIEHGAPGLCVAMSPDGRWLATGGEDGFVRLWSAADGQASGNPLFHHFPITSIQFSPDSRRILTVGGREVRLWESHHGEPAPFELKHDDSITAAEFSPSGESVMTVSSDGTLKMWDAITGERIRMPWPEAGFVQRFRFSPDGSWLLTQGAGELRLWRRGRNAQFDSVSMFPLRTSSFAFSSDARRLLIGDGSGFVQQIELSFDPVMESHLTRVPESGLSSLAEMFSGRELKNERLEPLLPASRWQRWVAYSDAALAVHPTSAIWHHAQALGCEEVQDSFGALFHWDEALKAKGALPAWGSQRAEAAARWLSWVETDSRRSAPPKAIRTRPTQIPREAIDLTQFYNAGLEDTWLPVHGNAAGNDLRDLVPGLHRFNGVDFDIRGVIQLSGSALENQGRKFPRAVNRIPVNQAAVRLRFLHATAWDAIHRTSVGAYRIRYQDGEMREVPLSFGENIREWWCSPTAPQHLTAGAVAWQGSNEASRQLGMAVRVYQMLWKNPRPEFVIESFDFVSAMERPAPFLLAVTVDPPSSPANSSVPASTDPRH